MIYNPTETPVRIKKKKELKLEKNSIFWNNSIILLAILNYVVKKKKNPMKI